MLSVTHTSQGHTTTVLLRRSGLSNFKLVIEPKSWLLLALHSIPQHIRFRSSDGRLLKNNMLLHWARSLTAIPAPRANMCRPKPDHIANDNTGQKYPRQYITLYNTIPSSEIHTTDVRECPEVSVQLSCTSKILEMARCVNVFVPKT